MSRNIPQAVRKYVAERANYRCEYCRVAEMDSNFTYHIEHIISKKHGGSDHPDNLALACSICNWKKGSNISTILEADGPPIPLFNPRKDDWFVHFEVSLGEIIPKTMVGAATAKLLNFNTPDNIIERRELMDSGNYP